MRHGHNNSRRPRGRNGGHGGGHHHNNHGNHGGGGNNAGRRFNPRVQTFDSNGPDVRIRGNAFQINEKYVTLARDAASSGDRVLAESYLQHAEHYQRMLNEAAIEFGEQQPQLQQPGFVNGVDAGAGEQPDVVVQPIGGNVVPAEQPSVDGNAMSQPQSEQGQNQGGGERRHHRHQRHHGGHRRGAPQAQGQQQAQPEAAAVTPPEAETA